jgi:hypothetical protein
MSEESSVSNNAEMQQYELRVGEEYALAGYSLEGDTIRFTHTEVPEEMEGQGIASRLIRGALADVRRRGLKVVPLCAFVRHYMDTHPETQDLLA